MGGSSWMDPLRPPRPRELPDPQLSNPGVLRPVPTKRRQVVKIAILDDYQNVALSIADWSAVAKKADITVFNDHIDQTDALIERLLPFDAICVMRERTPLRRDIIERLPRLRFIAWSQNLTAEAAEAAGAEFVTKNGLFRRADVVTIHLILSERTRGLVGAAELALMKPTARLINTSRGPIVDEQALIETLRARAIAGSAVDVFDFEPLPAKHPFRSLENLLATPHIGFVAEDLYRTFYGDAAAAIGAWIEKQAPSP